MGVLAETGLSMANPLLKLWEGFVNTLPGLVAAIVVIIVGYLIGLIVSWVLEKLLVKIDLDKWLIEKTKVKALVGDVKLSQFLALIAKWYIFILFLPPAASLVNLESLSSFLLSLALWIPNLIIAAVVGIIGFIVAEYVSIKVAQTKAKGALVISDVLKVIILLFTIIVVLQQLGIDISIVQNSFLIILGGIMAGIAIALGLGFGLALKEDAKETIRKIKKKF